MRMTPYEKESGDTSPHSKARYIAAVVLLAAASIGFLWLTDVPLGVPGEWTWERIGYAAWILPGLAAGLAAAVLAAGAYVGFCWAVGRRISRSPRLGVGGWLLLLAGSGFGLLLAVQMALPAGHDLARMPVVLYDPAASGYFTIARYGDDGGAVRVPELLAGYEERMRGGDVLHIGTHPPGLIVAHRGLIELCRRSPGVTRSVRSLTPVDVELAFDLIDRQARIGPVLSETDRAALWLAVLVTQAVAAAAVVPLYLLVRRYRSRVESWRAACLWPLVPALSVFLPKSDALFPFVGVLFLWLWLEGCARPSVVRSLAAGAVLWVGMSLSLAMLPVAALGAVLAAWEGRTAPAIGSASPAGRRLAVACVATAVGFWGPVVAVWLALDLNLPGVWLWNYRNHAGFYAEYDRTWWKWLAVNPAEFALAAGVPLAAAAAVGAWRGLRGGGGQAGPVIGCLAVWGAVWLWGKNMGEAARLWLVFQPWLVWLAAGAFSTQADSSRARLAGEGRWLWTLAVQAVVCLASVTRVSGFHYLPGFPEESPSDRPPAAGGADHDEADGRITEASPAGRWGQDQARRLATR
ncbi:MAG TPA: hypothetical protein VML55_06300 [Planctomycetaceae bacterium]|nr:hypothetical protein [Planctomycetaceae bacterium]